MEPGTLSLDLPPGKVRRLESCGREGFCWLTGEVRVVDDVGNDVLSGEIGEIISRGDMVMQGYWRMPEETAKVIDKDGWLHTGDLATIDEDGYIYVKGRKKEMIRSGGENIAPAEVEEVIRMHSAVTDVAVIGVPDEHWGEAVKAVIVLREGAKATGEEIIEFCKQKLAGYKKPRSVEFIDSLPMSASGLRVSKEALKTKYCGK
jgi:acyl-CoA synthetase (AMP-forming)/AMP-acid ligase II